MPSLQMRIIAAYLRLTNKRRSSSLDKARQQLEAPKGTTEPPRKLTERHAVSSRQVEGFECYTVTPGGPGTGRAAIYLHGGAYIGEAVPQHWALVSKLADAGVRVEVPVYGLAPQHTYRQAYPFLTAVYRDLLAEVGAPQITIAGDSAGGGLALGLAQTLGPAGLPQPGGLLLIAPWVDLTLQSPEVPAAEAGDPWLNMVSLIEWGRVWAGGDDPSSAQLSPVNGPLAGLAPLTLYAGTHDLLYPDIVALRDRAEAEGATVRLVVCEGAVHVYPLVPAPEGRRARDEIVREIAGA